MISKLIKRRSSIRFAVLFAALIFSSPCIADTSAKPVSLIELLTFPDRYVGDVIVVKGYLDVHAGLQLFLTKEHAEMRDYVSSIIISDTDNGDIVKSKCIGSYAEVKGTVDLQMGIVLILSNVTKIINPSTAVTCWRKQ